MAALWGMFFCDSRKDIESFLLLCYNKLSFYAYKTVSTKELSINEIRYRKISELFICQYSSIFIHNTHISKLFRYINSCISMQFHGRLVRNWCGSFEVIHFRKWVHHDTKNIISSLQLCVTRTVAGCFYLFLAAIFRNTILLPVPSALQPAYCYPAQSRQQHP